MTIWYCVNAKSPWRTIRCVEAAPKAGEKLAFIRHGDYNERMNIIGQTAFPIFDAAIANQTRRCEQNLKRSNGFILNVAEACKKRIEENRRIDSTKIFVGQRRKCLKAMGVMIRDGHLFSITIVLEVIWGALLLKM